MQCLRCGNSITFFHFSIYNNTRSLPYTRNHVILAQDLINCNLIVWHCYFNQCAVFRSKIADGNWTQCGSASERHVTINQLDLEDGEKYTVTVRAVNNAGLKSGQIHVPLIIETEKPILTGTLRNKNAYSMHFIWLMEIFGDISYNICLCLVQ